MNRIRCAAFLVAACALCSSGSSPAQDLSAALPEYAPFLKAVRQKLHSDRTLLSQYTYNVRTVTKTLDGNGKVKKIEEEVSEKYPSLWFVKISYGCTPDPRHRNLLSYLSCCQPKETESREMTESAVPSGYSRNKIEQL